MKIILDLQHLSEPVRGAFLHTLTLDDNYYWSATKELNPNIHPDRKSSRHYYRFECASHLDRARKLKSEQS